MDSTHYGTSVNRLLFDGAPAVKGLHVLVVDAGLK